MLLQPLMLSLYRISQQRQRCMSNSSTKRQACTVLNHTPPAKLDQCGQ
jgi:hypothetical protein